jgi:hypothetical protein
LSKNVLEENQMALIEKFFVVASEHPVGASGIKEGQIVMLNNSREIVPFNDAGSSIVLGVAGDTKATGASAMPGVYAGWQNRVNDSFNETAASDLMTVYHGGGEFATDQFEEDVLLALSGTYLYASSGGKLQSTATAKNPIAVLTRVAGPYPSGVPGIDVNDREFSGEQALKGEHNNQYIEFKLLV